MLEAITQLAQTHGRTLEVQVLALTQRETKTKLQQKIFGLRMLRCSLQEQTSTSHSLSVMEAIRHSDFLEKKATRLAVHLQLNRDGEQIILESSVHTSRGTTAETLDSILDSTLMEILLVAFCTMTVTHKILPFLAVLVFL